MEEKKKELQELAYPGVSEILPVRTYVANGLGKLNLILIRGVEGIVLSRRH